ncbi:hypothetical protein ACOME3_002664 [Neoechinorhynchus agilis]
MTHRTEIELVMSTNAISKSEESNINSEEHQIFYGKSKGTDTFKDEFWNALKPHYDYMMNNRIADLCENLQSNLNERRNYHLNQITTNEVIPPVVNDHNPPFELNGYHAVPKNGHQYCLEQTEDSETKKRTIEEISKEAFESLKTLNNELSEIELGVLNVVSCKERNKYLLRRSVYLIEDFQRRIKSLTGYYTTIRKLIDCLDLDSTTRFELTEQIEISEERWKSLWIRIIELECLLQKSFFVSIKKEGNETSPSIYQETFPSTALKPMPYKYHNKHNLKKSQMESSETSENMRSKPDSEIIDFFKSDWSDKIKQQIRIVDLRDPIHCDRPYYETEYDASEESSSDMSEPRSPLTAMGVHKEPEDTRTSTSISLQLDIGSNQRESFVQEVDRQQRIISKYLHNEERNVKDDILSVSFPSDVLHYSRGFLHSRSD